MNLKKRGWLLLAAVVVLSLFTGCRKAEKGVDVRASETDAQPYWNIFNQPVAKAENGYYYFKKNMESVTTDYLMYMDAQSLESTVVCNKAECTHRDESCNAFFSLEYECQSVYYYKGFVYVLKDNKSDGRTYLEQVAPDGSSRKTLFEVGVYWPGYKALFCQDSVFISNRIGGNGIEATKEVIRRRSLDGKEDENIYEYEAQGAQITAVKNYGDKLFFVVTEWPRENKESGRTMKSNGVFVYDLESRQTTHLLDENISDFTVNLEDGNIYYFVIDKGLYKRSLSGGEGVRIYECSPELYNNFCQISNDGKYLYLSNEQNEMLLAKIIKLYMWVLDYDGKVINEIETPQPYSTFFGDGQYVFGSTQNDNLAVIRKSEIESAKTWTKIP